MSGRAASLPSCTSAGGQELQPCEVKSSTDHGPPVGSAAALRPASNPVPAMRAERVRWFA